MEKDFEKTTEMLQEMQDCLVQIKATKFFSMARDYILEHPLYPGLIDELDTRCSNYQRMSECYIDSIDDPQRSEIYKDIRKFMVDTYMNILLNETISRTPVLLAAKKRASKINLLDIQEKLADKEPDNDLYNGIFSAVLVSWMWDDKTSDYFNDLILNSHIDVKPKLLIVSAVTMACLHTFDFNKFSFLVDLYEKDVEIELKQRALVGWVFSSCCMDPLWEDAVNDIISDLLESEEVRFELVALQKQILFCLDAEKDALAVDKDIMSHLNSGSVKSMLNNDPFDSNLSDIIHPEVEEEKAEKLEQSVLRMAKMEKAGSDVYFHGFSHLKSFAFFHSLYNWFMPFYAKNPLLARIKEVMDGDDAFLRNLEASSPFCDSDKYSLALGMEMTLASAPALKALVKENFMFGSTFLSQEGVDEATLERRMYLQDLYRFFRVSSFYTAFENPFDDDNEGESPCYFLRYWNENGIRNFTDLIDDMILGVCRFLVKRKDYERLSYFVVESLDANYEMIYYSILSMIHHDKDYHKACVLAMTLDQIKPNNEKIMRLLARCLSEIGMYDKAAVYYKKIVELKPTDGVKLKLAACYLKSDDTQLAMEILHEMYFRFPEQPDVLRLLAWGYVQEGKFDKAIETYDKLSNLNKKLNLEQVAEDVYNVGICYWLKHDNHLAFEWFLKYSKIKSEEDDDLVVKFSDDSEFIQKFNFRFEDALLMSDIVGNALLKEK